MGKTDAEGGISSKTYDADGRLTKTVNEEGAVTEYIYDADNRVVEMIDALGNSTTYTYDEMDRVLTVTDPRGGVTTYTYTDRGDVATETDAEGYTISYVYDGNHNMVKKTTVDGDTTYVYDELDRLISTTTPDGKTETMEYDGLGRVTSVTDKGGHKTQYVCDAAGNVIQTIDAKGNVAAFEYDLMGNLTKVTLHRVDTQDGVDEYEVTLYEYDGRGLVTKVVDALGNVTTTEYDGNGNVSKVTDADGYVTEYTYNALDMVTNINYNGGKEVSYQYNAVGDLVRMEDWTGVNTFEVDLLNRITKVTDHKGKVVTYGYDATGNQTSIGYPDGTSVTKTYDLVNNLESVTETDGRTTTYTYDGMRRVTHMEYPDGWQEDYTYDAIGQLLSIYDTDPSGKDMKQQKNRFEYDACGNMTYEYMCGNGTGEATVEVYYTYDELHQVVTAQENYGNKSRSYQYDSLGNLTWETNSNNVTVDYKLNNLNQITTSSDDGWKTSTTYTYDDRGNLIQELYTKNKKQSITGAYTFDETNKMVKGVNDLGESSEYLYNGLGALVTNTWTIKKNAYGYHDVTALTTSTMVEGEIVVDKQTGKKEKKDKKDPEVVLADAELNKTSTVVKDFVIDYTVETMDPLYETESTTDGLEYRYVYGLDDVRLSVTVKGVENGAGHIIENGDEIRLYYHQDLRGTVDYLTSPVSGKVESWTHYNEWGEITHNAVLKCGQRELDLVKNYTGHEYDAVLGMYYAKARFYDAENRRFISVDRVKGNITEPLTLVQYIYVINNPLILVDPTGDKYKLSEGTIAHTVITTYIEFLYPGSLNDMYIYGLTRTKSGRGRPDIVIEQNGIYHVYEIKSDTYLNGWNRKQYGGAAFNQLSSYIQALRNNPSLNPDFPLAETAQAGTILNWSNHVILPYFADAGKVVDAWTVPGINGMIFYQIRDERDNDKVESEEFATEKMWQTIRYYAMVSCEYAPEDELNLINVDTYGDLELNDSIINWLDDVEVTDYDPQSSMVTNFYITITYPDGVKYYHALNSLELMGIVRPQTHFSYKELLEIYDGMSSDWTQSLGGAGNQNVLVPSPDFGILPVLPAFNPGLIPVLG